MLGLLSFFEPVTSAFILALFGLVFGAVVGLLFGLIGHAMSGGRRDFSSVGAVRASRYDVVVDEVAGRRRAAAGRHVVPVARQ